VARPSALPIEVQLDVSTLAGCTLAERLLETSYLGQQVGSGFRHFRRGDGGEGSRKKNGFLDKAGDQVRAGADGPASVSSIARKEVWPSMDCLRRTSFRFT